MRPLRFLLLLALFVALPILLTCFSLLHSAQASSQPLGPSFRPRQSRFRALLSFTTPSSLFPPSAVISLTNDNSTFFLARPAAFGPSLPSSGLSGQLWVGKGFGEEISLSDEEIRIHGYELGCSDVPGWDEEYRNKVENGAIKIKSSETRERESARSNTQSKKPMSKRGHNQARENTLRAKQIDGTDDHLHQPLPDSNPTLNTEPGEPANAMPIRGTASTHADIESMQESADIAGKIVMLSRGGCGFLEKVKWAQRRGGIGLIVGDNQPGGQLTIMYAKGDVSNVTIPALFTSYNAAHLLSSLVPSEKKTEENKDISDSKNVVIGKQKGGNSPEKGNKPDTKQKMPTKPPAAKPILQPDLEHGWVQNVLSAVGLSDEDADFEDSRRPPSSGNIDWVLLEDWDEQRLTLTATSAMTSAQPKTTTKPSFSSRTTAARTTGMLRVGNDDFVIGVQDWRDTELLAPKSTTSVDAARPNGKQERATQQASPTASGRYAAVTPPRGRTFTPGSGEYDHGKFNRRPSNKQNREGSSGSDEQALSENHRSMRDKFRAFFYHTDERKIIHSKPKDGATIPLKHSPKPNEPNDTPDGKPREQEGLWVTLTPTSVSTSPFFDTLLVLVVSPLVTLTVVYGLLLIRSRIRRRRWRAPKSVVERLPVRTYHTMTATSSTTSSIASSPAQSTTSSPQMRPSSARPRPRSQTTTGVVSSPPEKLDANNRVKKHKRYTGRQVECVVCLEEYVDGESKVMSLPCGHEFHAECITPWLVTRRRTCPICKGDVVRSFSHSGAAAEDDTMLPGEHTSDDIQDRVAETVNDDASAAIPIPVRDAETIEEDIERGDTLTTPLLGPIRPQTGWRGMLGASISRLSGDTLWRSTPNDRTR